MKSPFFFVAMFAGAAVAHAQQMDNPVLLPVSFYGEAVVASGGQPYTAFSFGSPLGATAYGAGSYLIGGTQLFSPVVTGSVIPGKDYAVQVTSVNCGVVVVRFAEVPGYEIFLGPTFASSRSTSFTMGYSYTFHFRLEAKDDVTTTVANNPGGACSSLVEDKPIWYISLGRMRNGRPAGAAGFRATTITSALWSPSSLVCDSPDTSEVTVTRDGNGLITQVKSREVVLQTADIQSTYYKINVYNIDASGNQGSLFRTYTIQQYASGAGVQIVKTENSEKWATALQKVGNDWTWWDWRECDQYDAFDDSSKRVVTQDNGSTTRTMFYGGTDAVSTPVVKRTKTYASHSWSTGGSTYELTAVTMGTGQSAAPTSTYAYYTDSTGNGSVRQIYTITDQHAQNWTRYDYYNGATDTRQGLPLRIFRPWLDNSNNIDPAGATTGNSYTETYDYATNYDGTTTAPASKLTQIEGTEVAKTEWTYNWNIGSANGYALGQTIQKDYYSSAGYLETTTLAYKPNVSVTYFQAKPHAITRPDGTKDAYAYYSGTWDGTTFTFTPNSGGDKLILVFHGQRAAGTGSNSVSSWTGWTLDTVHLFPNRSTVTETVIDTRGRVVLRAENIYTGSGIERISGTFYAYAANNDLDYEKDILRSVSGADVLVDYNYRTDGLLEWKKDIDGMKTSYGYDTFLRRTTVTTAADGGTGYPAKTETTTYNLADLKATVQNCSCGTDTTNYVYERTGRIDYTTEPKPGGGDPLLTDYAYAWTTGGNHNLETTITLPTSATLITTLYEDGRGKSETGTGRVPTTYVYEEGDYALTKATHHQVASESAYPWSEEKTDGLGRVVQQRTPQIGWTTSQTNKAVRKTYSYNTSTGQLVKVETVDEAASLARLLPDHLYVYTDSSSDSPMGLLLAEGDDLNSNGNLDASSTDRITFYTTSFYKDTWDMNGWVRQDITKVYRDSSNLTTVSDRRTRFTRFNYGAAWGNKRQTLDVVEFDASGRWTVTSEWADPVARTRTRYVERAGDGTANTIWQDGYLKDETSATGVTTTRTYNSQGLVSSVTDVGTSEVVSTTYHSGTAYVATTTRNTGAGGTTATSYSYSWNPSDQSHTVCTTDSAGNPTYTEYDAKGQVWRTWGTATRPTVSTYDAYGRRTYLTTYQDGTSGTTWSGSSFNTPATTQWVYSDSAGLNTSKVYPGGATVSYTYNPRGQLATRTWARTPAVTTTYTYDSLTGELTQKSYNDGTPTVSFTYNRFGALATANQSGVTNRSFGYRTDLQREYEYFDSYFGARTLTSTYDSTGRPTGHSFNGNVTVSTTAGYNSAGQIGSVQGICQSSSATFNLGYLSGTDWVETITQGSFRRTQTLATARGVLDRVLTQWWNGSAWETRGDFDSGFDSLGRRNDLYRGGTVAFGGNNQHHFGYNTRHEVQGETNDQDSAKNTTFTFDLTGDRATMVENAGTTTYADDVTNKYTSITGVRGEPNINHDTDGNLLQDGTWTYTWDGENRLKSMSRTSPTQTITFTYDYLDRRIRKQITGTGADDRKYIWQGWTLVAETTGDGSTIYYSFVWGPDFSGPSCGGAGGAGGLLGIYSPGAALNYAVPDAMGNIAGYLDSSGTVNAAYEYNAFGFVRQQTGAMTALPFGFASQYTDRESGLVYYGYRYYNAVHGRFINRDPIEESGGNNLYAFVGNNPANHWDVLGLCTFSDGRWWGNDCFQTWPNWPSSFGLSDWDFLPSFPPRPPPPRILHGSFDRPSFARLPANFGWERDWRISDAIYAAQGMVWGDDDGGVFGNLTYGYSMSRGKYWKGWKKLNPFRDKKLDKRRLKTLDRGCVGVTCLNIGEPGMPDTSNCYKSRAQAEARMAEMRRNGECSGLNPNKQAADARLFSIHLWSDTGSDGTNPDVTFDSSGKADLSNWDVEGRPPGPWKKRGGGYNFDYGIVDDAGNVVHANHVHDPGGRYGPMTVYVDDAATWGRSNTDFNTEVWCASCNTDKF